ncbi:tRNA-(ms[2]io[6]A)-hydroxylase [Wohlfahrtiimonas sp. G9077]|uniref:tRNA-(ms[2]io[6]A)-hydroxylase n=1 Tax=Wohlfahrtiimonas sp. G9077 TaxID=1980118 RepID=UPI000B983B04|nr:tRNA isopentenyl-2-thiomethyl-A-37 hydroxylase MiaE [Wohlfahrtiimonas sp. G9077]OYQ74585.1 tRNA-(ms[2]io[6]A)-hydroxylase [Wohlfahrtiimonas sp. G9077]
MAVLLPEIETFLQCETPQAWIDEAKKPENMDILLIDHANCEKKAAFTALNLIMKYTELEDLQHKMSRLAREELRHFEQVAAIMKKRNVTYRYLEASKYAERLRQHLRKTAKERLTDILIIGAYIEARSCERFYRVAPHLDDELNHFYNALIKSEGRHYQDYLKLAEKYAGQSIDERVAFFGDVEKAAILTPDPVFRFHSGIPA